MLTQRAVYFDCNATHPLLPAVRRALSEEVLARPFALLNPSSVHRHGQRARAMVAELRAQLGAVAGRSDGDEWIFGSGATEAINTVLRGFVTHRESEGRRATILTSSADHAAVLDTLPFCRADSTHVIGVDNAGQPDLVALEAALLKCLSDSSGDALVSLNLLNNETGVLLDVDAFAQVLQRVRAKFEDHRPVEGAKKFQSLSESRRVWLHLDAAQALGKLDPRLLRLAWYQADYVSLSAHKMGGAVGIGALWLRPQVPFAPFMTGGVQEKKRRAGSFNSLSAFAWKTALEDWAQNGDTYRSRLSQIRSFLHQKLSAIEGYRAHGLSPLGELPAAPNTLNFDIAGCDEESLVMALDVEGFSVSSGSACNSGSLKPSHVLLAMGYDTSVALSSVRLSLGIENTESEALAFVEALTKIVHRIRDSKSYWLGVLPQMKSSHTGTSHEPRH